MNGFYYFFPKVQSVGRELIDRLNLSYATTVVSGGRSVSGGPGGHNGIIIGKSPSDVGEYRADRQTWVAGPQGTGDYPPFYVGWWNEKKPRPDDLARDKQFEGDRLTFVDGSRWVVPKVREWVESNSEEIPALWRTQLPVMVSMDRYGAACEGPVVPQYRDVFDLSLKVLAQLSGRGEVALSPKDLIAFAANLLSMNYRVGLFELSSLVMDCMSTSDANQVIMSAIDWEGYEAALKKWIGRSARPDIATPSG